MDARHDDRDELLILAARALTGHKRRLFIGDVARRLCDANPRQAEVRFGWGRDTVAKGMRERDSGIRCLENFKARGCKRWEDRHPQLAKDIAAIVEPYTQADPELRSSRRYTNLSAAEVRQTLITQKHYRAEDLPAERTLRNILNRMNYRLKRIQKGKPLKKRPETDAIFANIAAVKAECQADPTSLEVSMDTKTKVALGEYSRGGGNPDKCGR
jgi:hypothetical protein